MEPENAESNVQEKIFKPQFWNKADFDDAGKLNVMQVEGEIVKYFASVYPDTRIAMKIPYEARITADQLPKLIQELGMISFLMFREKNQTKSGQEERVS